MMPYCVVRSRSVTMADAEPTPMIRSPSQWPASSLVSAEAGRWSIIVLLAIVGPCPVRVSHRDFRIRRPVRSFRQYFLCRVVLSRSSSSR